VAESEKAGGYVIWVDFEIHPEHMERFETLLRANARASLALEAGCRRFDVLVPLPGANAVSLYEIYDDEAAFQAHLASEHYRTFAARTADAVRHKQVRAFQLHPT
jgi:quinol monooxygenase YgiN